MKGNLRGKRHRKWHKSPHNRFKINKNSTIGRNNTSEKSNFNHQRSHYKSVNKSLPKAKIPQEFNTKEGISYKLIRTILILFMFTYQLNNSITLLALNINNGTTTKPIIRSQDNSSFGNNNNNNATTRSNFDSKEGDEVEVLPQTRNNNHRARKAKQMNLNRPHIYKVRAAGQFNGRLTMPIRIEASDATSVVPGPHDYNQKLKFDSNQQRQAEVAQLEFGARSGANTTRVFKGTTTKNGETDDDNKNCTTNESQHQAGNIAASSQTLRLFNKVFNNNSQSLIGSPTININNAQQHKAGFVSPTQNKKSIPLSIDNNRNVEIDESDQSLSGSRSATRISAQAGQLSHATSSLANNQESHLTTTSVNNNPVELAKKFSSNRNNNKEEDQSISGTVSVIPTEENVLASSTSNSESILTLIDEYDSKITTNRTKAHLSCDSGEMILRLNFSEPFKGIVYPNHERLSPCRFFGDGHHNYELRLPLRGCGTRQAAPRFFVNDVIVRFHKTLELEEDEVKTLICRYPPPLAPLPSETISNNNNSRLNSNNIDQENSPGFPSFELVDPINGRPLGLGSSRNSQNVILSGLTNSSGGSGLEIQDARGGGGSTSGNIETFSENLVVAPSSDLNNLNNQRISDPYLMNGARNNNLSNNNIGLMNKQQKPINLITADLFDSRNSMITTGNNSDPASASFFERFSSIELLVLISSLMFLILLALCSFVSYYLLKRNQLHRRRRVVGLNGTGERASAILKRSKKNNYRYPSPASTSAVMAAANPINGGVYARPQTMLTGPLQAQAHLLHRYQQHNQRLSTAPSSPDDLSDLSARGHLLAASSTPANANTSVNNNNMTSSDYYAMFNRAYIPDFDQQQHYLVPATFGRRSKKQHQSRVNNIPRGSSYQQQSLNRYHHNNKQLPVVGRRDNFYHPAQISNRHHNNNSQQQYFNTIGLGFTGKPMRVAYSEDPLMMNEQHFSSPEQQQQQQLLLSPSSIVTTNGDANQRSRNLRQNLAKYSLMNIDGDEKYNKRDLHRAEHIFVAGQAANNVNNRQLLRAKSLSSVYHNKNFDSNQQENDNNHYLIGGTLSRHEQAATKGLNHHPMKQKHYNYYRDNNFQYKNQDLNSSRKNRIEYSSPSFEEGEGDSDNNNNSNLIHDNERLKQKHKPKILLKSIEDSYITNLTEIYEQEYKKRDSTRQISVSEWGRMLPKKQHNKNDSNDIKTISGSQFVLDKRKINDLMATTTTSSESEQDYENDIYHRENINNLRSLTELDVNFAKSSLMINPTNGNSLKRQQQKIISPTTNQSISQLESDDDNRLMKRVEVQANLLNRSNSMPEVVKSSQHLQQQQRISSSSNIKDLAQINQDQNNKVRNNQIDNNDQSNLEGRILTSPESPDLILSPEYDHGQQQRLELIEPHGSISSHNSVSYV